MAASIAHEISQPPSGITASANAGLSWLSRPTPDLDEARVALKSIVSSDRRASEVITGIRSIFKKGPLSKAPHNINEMVSKVLTLVRSKVESQQVSVRIELAQELPPGPGEPHSNKARTQPADPDSADRLHASMSACR